MQNETTEQVRNMNLNPTGKGGFLDNPQNRNNGGRYPRGESLTFWYGIFKNMTVAEFKGWKDANPEDTRTVVADLAYSKMENAKNNLREFQEVADRSEGRPRQDILTKSDDVSSLKIEIVHGLS